MVEVVWDRGGAEVARRQARAYACALDCRFVLLVHRDVVRVEALVPENGWMPTEAPLEGAVRILDTDVPVTDWYR